MKTNLMHVRINVSDLKRSEKWYTDILGFKVDTEWPPERPEYIRFESEGGAVFAIMEADDCRALRGRIDFYVDDVDALWKKLRGKAHVAEDLHTTSYDTRKFTIQDPDGNKLSFVQG
ncbi:hypothetical protein CEY16_13705 [Halalkalibacillus sediminis]|uniref:VOC domain-containing protein n=1 Tax=Halalkalibacillus sediminis TaxID=2018042 RepID=A0A2I0QRA4_9BACI|nr:VOC family protein [Halalkalibacillus sediminis]PKR76864.1 hypothetical protein CEY16_13705 [Halalkalibacillus sediminis]